MHSWRLWGPDKLKHTRTLTTDSVVDLKQTLVVSTWGQASVVFLLLVQLLIQPSTNGASMWVSPLCPLAAANPLLPHQWRVFNFSFKKKPAIDDHHITIPL